MDARPSTATEALKGLEPLLAQQLAENPRASASVLGIAHVLEAAASELEALAGPRSDVHELQLIGAFLTAVVRQTDDLMRHAVVPSGEGLDRVRMASKRLNELAIQVDGWFRDARRAHVRRGMRTASWESLERATGAVAIGGDAVEDCRNAGRG